MSSTKRKGNSNGKNCFGSSIADLGLPLTLTVFRQNPSLLIKAFATAEALRCNSLDPFLCANFVFKRLPRPLHLCYLLHSDSHFSTISLTGIQIVCERGTPEVNVTSSQVFQLSIFGEQEVKVEKEGGGTVTVTGWVEIEEYFFMALDLGGGGRVRPGSGPGTLFMYHNINFSRQSERKKMRK